MATALQAFLERTRRRPPSHEDEDVTGMFGTSSNVMTSALQAPPAAQNVPPPDPSTYGDGGGNAPGNYGEWAAQQPNPVGGGQSNTGTINAEDNGLFGQGSYINTGPLGLVAGLAVPGLGTAISAAETAHNYNVAQDNMATWGAEDSLSPASAALNAATPFGLLGSSPQQQEQQAIDNYAALSTPAQVDRTAEIAASLTGGYADEAAYNAGAKGFGWGTRGGAAFGEGGSSYGGTAGDVGPNYTGEDWGPLY